MPQFQPDGRMLHQYFSGLLIAQIILSFVLVPVIIFGQTMLDNSMDASAEASAETTNSEMMDASAEASAETTNSEMMIAVFYLVFLLVLIPATIASWIGLFLYKNWGRWLYFAMTVFSTLLNLSISIFDFSATWGFVSSLLEIDCMLTGAILVMIFLTQLANRFNKPIEASFVKS